MHTKTKRYCLDLDYAQNQECWGSRGIVNMHACMKDPSYYEQSLPHEAYLASKNLFAEFQASENLESLQDKTRGMKA